MLELMKEKEPEKIAVTDITTKADLNRTTFYSHYPDVRGILEEFEREAIDRLMVLLEEFKYEYFFRIQHRFFCRLTVIWRRIWNSIAH